MKFILPVQFYCHLPVSQNPIPFLIGIFDKGTQFLVEFFVRADLSVKPFIISRAWNPRKFAEFGYRAFLFAMYFLYCQTGRFILYLAQNRLLSISSSFFKNAISNSTRSSYVVFLPLVMVLVPPVPEDFRFS